MHRPAGLRRRACFHSPGSDFLKDYSPPGADASRCAGDGGGESGLRAARGHNSGMADQGELFGLAAAPEPDAPLATRMRPRSFEDLVGQRRVVEVLRQLTRSGHLPSIVLWGPPGSGKTTLANLLATETSD